MLSEAARALLGQALKAAEDEGYHMWGFWYQPNALEMFHFSSNDMSREEFAANTSVALQAISGRGLVCEDVLPQETPKIIYEA